MVVENEKKRWCISEFLCLATQVNLTMTLSLLVHSAKFFQSVRHCEQNDLIPSHHHGSCLKSDSDNMPEGGFFPRYKLR